MKVNDKDFRETVEKIVVAIISTQSNPLSTLNEQILGNKDTRSEIVEAAIKVTKDIYTGVKKVQNSGQDSINIQAGDQFTTNTRSIS